MQGALVVVTSVLKLVTINPTLIKVRKQVTAMIVVTGIWSPSGLFIASPGRAELL